MGRPGTTYSGSCFCLLIIHHSSQPVSQTKDRHLAKISPFCPLIFLGVGRKKDSTPKEIVSTLVLTSGMKLVITQQDFCTQSWFLSHFVHNPQCFQILPKKRGQVHSQYTNKFSRTLYDGADTCILHNVIYFATMKI